MEKLLKTKQVAEIFGVDKRTVLYTLISKGLKYLKVGREYRFKQSDIEEFIKNQTYQKEQNIFIVHHMYGSDSFFTSRLWTELENMRESHRR